MYSRCKFLVTILLTVVGCSSCVTVKNTDDFAVVGEFVQHVSATDIRTVVIRCYCPTRVVRQTPGSDEVQLFINATHSSVGYHGSQFKPKEVAPSLIRFTERANDGVLVLESREYLYMHHAYIINSLEVSAPPDREVRIEPITYSALDGRSVE